jgi:hypothetical protein
MRAVVSSLPKSGTHFINLVLAGMGMRRVFLPAAPTEEIAEAAIRLQDGEFVLQHLAFSAAAADKLQAAGVATVAVVRDPRDFVVSFAHHAQRMPAASTEAMVRAAADMHDLQQRICTPELNPHGKPVPSILTRYLNVIDGWLKDGRAMTVRFEDMIGPRGGGRISDQLTVGLRLYERLQPPCDLDAVVHAMVRGFNPTIDLFRKGQTEAWRHEMRPELAARIWEEQREIFRRWGYREEGGVAPEARIAHPGLDDINERAFRLIIQDLAAARAVAEAAAEP